METEESSCVGAVAADVEPSSGVDLVHPKSRLISSIYFFIFFPFKFLLNKYFGNKFKNLNLFVKKYWGGAGKSLIYLEFLLGTFYLVGVVCFGFGFDFGF